MFWSLNIGIWDLFGIWCLKFVICSNDIRFEWVSHFWDHVKNFSHLSLTAMLWKRPGSAAARWFQSGAVNRIRIKICGDLCQTIIAATRQDCGCFFIGDKVWVYKRDRFKRIIFCYWQLESTSGIRFKLLIFHLNGRADCRDTRPWLLYFTPHQRTRSFPISYDPSIVPCRRDLNRMINIPQSKWFGHCLKGGKSSNKMRRQPCRFLRKPGCRVSPRR